MIDIFDDEITQMEENEASTDSIFSEAIQLKDPVRTLAKECVTRSEDNSLEEIIDSFQRNSTSCIILTKNKKVSGIFTERDIVLNVLGRGLNFSESTIQKYMTPDPHTLRMGDPVSFALNMMVDGGFRHIPLVDKDNQPRGIISIMDIVEHLGYVFHKEVMNLPPSPLRKQSKQEGG